MLGYMILLAFDYREGTNMGAHDQKLIYRWKVRAHSIVSKEVILFCCHLFRFKVRTDFLSDCMKWQIHAKILEISDTSQGDNLTKSV